MITAAALTLATLAGGCARVETQRPVPWLKTRVEAEVARRFGILPNFFRSAEAAPELIQQLWGFAQAGYLDTPMPAVFKEQLFRLALPLLSDALLHRSACGLPAWRGSWPKERSGGRGQRTDGLVALLRLMGFQARHRQDGQSGIRSAIEEPPEFIFCDLGLGRNGRIRRGAPCYADPSLRSARLIAFSGYSSPRDHAEAKAAGFERLLTKPVTRDSLALITRVGRRW